MVESAEFVVICSEICLGSIVFVWCAHGNAVTLMMVVMFQMLGMCSTSAPVTALSVAFYPRNNIMAVGSEDSTILIFWDWFYYLLTEVGNFDIAFLFHPGAR